MLPSLKLRGLIIGTTAGVALVGGVSLLLFLSIGTRIQQRVQQQALLTSEDEEVAHRINDLVRLQADIARVQSATPNPLLEAQFDSLGSRVHQAIRFYSFRDLSIEERRLVERIREQHARLEVAGQHVFIGERYAAADSLANRLTTDLGHFLELRREHRARVNALHSRITQGFYGAVLIISLLFTLITFKLMGLLRRRLLDRISRLAGAAVQVGQGDFEAQVELGYDDELTELGLAFNGMVADLREKSASLQLSEHRYRSLFNRVPVGVYRTTPEGRFEDANDACVRLLGFDSLEELLACNAEEMIGGEQRRAWQQELASRTGSYAVTWRLDRPDGAVCWVRDNAHAVRGPSGEVLYYEGALEDITERVLAQEALQRSEARFRSLLEKGSDAIIVIDTQGRLQYQSPSVERMLGYPPDEILNRDIFELVHPDDVAQVRAELRHLTGDRQGADFIEFRCRNRMGDWRVMHAIGSNLLDDPNVSGIVVNMVDLTEQRRLEERFLHAQKMEVVGRLAGGIAHDFNNLLTAIGGYAELLACDGEGSSDVQEIQRAVQRASSLTRQLLAFSRQQIVQPRSLDLSAVTAEMRGMLERLIGETIELRTELDPGIWVVADRSQLEQVVLNLVVNARDAMPAGGTLTVATQRLQVGPEHPVADHLAPGAYAELCVSDTGLGMQPAVLARVFEPFFTTKEVGKGTGLGLATVYGIARQAGGAVTAESRHGAGSVFCVYLPLTNVGAEQALTREVERPSVSGQERILLVEDETAVRQLAERVLRRQGYEVITASNGAEALERMASLEHGVDIVVTDVVMPELGGPALAEQLRLRQPGLRVLFISGYARESFGITGSLDESVNFLEKPFTPAQLARKVREILDRDRSLA